MKELLRRTWAEIDLDALAQNFREVRKAADPKAMVCCVVKADAYGHGAVRVAREFASLGRRLVRRVQPGGGTAAAPWRGLRPQCWCWATPRRTRPGTLSRENISQCVYSLEYARGPVPLRPGGGGRGEHPPEDRHRHEPPGLLLPGHQPGRGPAVEEVKEACSLPGLVPQGIFTHFAVSDEGQAGDAFTMRQFGCLKEMIESLARAGVTFPVRHCANSAGVFDYPLSHLDMVRAGIVLYGLYPSGELRSRPALKPPLR